MRKEFLITIIWVKFCFNYPNPDEFIDYICEKCEKRCLKKHLRAKFDNLYDIFGSGAVMNRFFCDIDEDLQEALVEYAINIYAPHGMKSKYKEYMNL